MWPGESEIAVYVCGMQNEKRKWMCLCYELRATDAILIGLIAPLAPKLKTRAEARDAEGHKPALACVSCELAK